ncbi:hypothetical protein K493DRAFT_332708 [Basidiobolus meristosporus CBS 931.73]|uniref:Arrestin C-terminal-like domain-containing protein n=1 Tax=Basidiobolus meristosporus CBS 931.73 TaxID=1314790 RepID=A0A1Y1ZBH1_9FUNG|nr:hypothetical protein K493DRAFT_332708 [Basidiobolus meristosporus CBS 931.73]|eukprot:ORY07642.1 hypothetical protein K493DRAFT_332708 [Basidiobolus meristosporus CBS 931.73]
MFSSSTLTIALQTDTLFTNFYTAEDTTQMALRGSVVINANSTLKAKRLSLQFNGKLSMQFPASIKKTRRDLVDQTIILFEHEKATPISGQRSFPFELLVPSDLPESFCGEYGKIKYSLKAIVETPFINSDLKSEVPIMIQRNAATSTQQEFTGEYTMEGGVEGKLTCNVTLPTSEYIPGEKFDVQMSALPLIDSVSVSNITCTLKEYTHFHIPSKNDQTRLSVAEYMKCLSITSSSFRNDEQEKTLLMKAPESASCSCFNPLVEISHVLSMRISWESSEGRKDSFVMNIPITIVSLIGSPDFDQLPKYQTIELPPTYHSAIRNPEDDAVVVCLPPPYHHIE